MRVTGGVLRGRVVKVPRGDLVRPTQDMVRQALCSSLAANLGGCRFLDLFAGSGAVGLEAWSRDARWVCWVEGNARVLPVLQTNVRTLCGSETGTEGERSWRVVRGDVFRFLSNWNEPEPCDIVFADPPYDRSGEARWAGRLLDLLASPAIVAAAGIFVMEQTREEGVEEHFAWERIMDRQYGGTKLIVYRKRGDSES